MSYTAIKIWNGTNSTWPRSPILKWWPGSGAFAVLISCPKSEPCSDLQEFAFSNHRENPFSLIFWLCFYSKACTLLVSFDNYIVLKFGYWKLLVESWKNRNFKRVSSGTKSWNPVQICKDLHFQIIEKTPFLRFFGCALIRSHARYR